MEEHVHGFVPGHCQHGLFPELATNNFPLFQTSSYQVRDSFLPTVRRLQCRVLQMTLDVKDFVLLEILRPILRGALNLHFMCAHGHHHGDLHRQSLENVFQATRRCPTVLYYHAAKHKSILAVTNSKESMQDLIHRKKDIQSITFKASLEAPTKRFLCRRCS